MFERESKRKSADCSVRRSTIHRQGVFAKKPFSKGDILLAIDDSDPVRDRRKLTPEEEIFIDVYIDVEGKVKTTWMKSPERFINHSCEPNSYVLTDMTSGVRRCRALKNMRIGDELTWDYALNIWEEWVGPVPCHCGAEDCRRIIRGNFFTLPLALQRRYLPVLDEPFRMRFAAKLRSIDPAFEPHPA
jgi:SET domain-containing protein